MDPNRPDPTRREVVRQTLLDAIPRWYSPWLHLLGTTGVGIAALALAAFRIRALRPAELLIVPATLVLANFIEWHAHKNLLHRRRFPTVLYDRHTPQHHVVYTEEAMAIRDPRELRLVLIPATGVLAVVVTTAPFALLSALLFSANTGYLLLATAAVYVVSYELSHLAYHLPESTFIGRSRLVRVLREHHARHHDPRRMQQWNFNVTLPLWDWILGTLAPAHGKGTRVRPKHADAESAKGSALRG
jgi:hypothetical protein